MSSLKILAIGDVHFKVNNVPEIEEFIQKVIDVVIKHQPDLIVVLGDILHTHEKIHTIPLNLAYKFIEKLKDLCETWVIVGNHDMISCSQFLTEHHWLNGMKKWDNVHIADKVYLHEQDGFEFVMTPYVPPGRFVEALNTLNTDWKEADCIFAHQEFFGCKMGAIVSSEGDKWELSWPRVVSGHIHSKQQIQENIYYTGSAMQHAFGESEHNTVALLTFIKNKWGYTKEEIDLEMPRKKIVYMSVKELDEKEIKTGGRDKIKITVSGIYEEFKALRKSKKYKDLIERGVKVVFKTKRVKNVGEASETVKGDFVEILQEKVKKRDNACLTETYKLVMGV